MNKKVDGEIKIEAEAPAPSEGGSCPLIHADSALRHGGPAMCSCVLPDLAHKMRLSFSRFPLLLLMSRRHVCAGANSRSCARINTTLVRKQTLGRR